MVQDFYDYRQMTENSFTKESDKIIQRSMINIEDRVRLFPGRELSKLDIELEHK